MGSKIANRITGITKRDILELFRDGMEAEDLFETLIVTYPYYGRLEELDFLSRLYDLNAMESNDSRFLNAYGDIWQHTVNNDDYPPDQAKKALETVMHQAELMAEHTEVTDWGIQAAESKGEYRL